MPEQLRPESKDLGEAATFIPHSSKAFIRHQRDSTSPGLTLSPHFSLFIRDMHLIEGEEGE